MYCPSALTGSESYVPTISLRIARVSVESTLLSYKASAALSCKSESVALFTRYLLRRTASAIVTLLSLFTSPKITFVGSKSVVGDCVVASEAVSEGSVSVGAAVGTSEVSVGSVASVSVAGETVVSVGSVTVSEG
ncbi:MAG: hypothetical protein PUB76_09790 [Oscillospiraceae bacterium]|nr:hypothetical protein [Oscillospiraceae bacterium]